MAKRKLIIILWHKKTPQGKNQKPAGYNEEGKVYTNIIPYFKLLIQNPNIADKTIKIARQDECKKEPLSPKKQ